jgi:beta-hydroxyacyl-ACP dehydratase FabZ
MEKPYNILDIMKRLPHRYPFLLIDRIVELNPGKKVVAIKNVTFNEPFFTGHFPNEPIMPGVLIVEAMAQAGGVLAWESTDKEKQAAMTFYFTAMDRVRFRKPVVPGDQLTLEVELLRLRSTAAKMTGTAKVGDKLVAEAQMMASIGMSA